MSPALFPVPHIIGGGSATQNEFPYQVLLEHNNTASCGGVILSTFFILTAAHCVDSKKPKDITIIAGEHARDKLEGTEQRHYVSKFEMHENYSGAHDYQHDITLLLLSEPLKFNEYVNNISYPKNGTVFNGTAIAIGWGKRYIYFSGSNILRKVNLPIVPTIDCQKFWDTLNVSGYWDGVICAGTTSMKTCHGDSGGALLCSDQNINELVLCGITSFGGFQCGMNGEPSVFTKVSSYTFWIQKTLQKLENTTCSSNEFQCLSKKCLKNQWVCDGDKKDCENGEDEWGCNNLRQATTPTLTTSTPSTTTMQFAKRHYSTPSTSTTPKPVCGNVDEFHCIFKGIPVCFPSRWKCDGYKDCDKGEDEVGCSTSAPSTTPIPLTTPIHSTTSIPSTTTIPSTTSVPSTTPIPSTLQRSKMLQSVHLVLSRGQAFLANLV